MVRWTSRNALLRVALAAALAAFYVSPRRFLHADSDVSAPAEDARRVLEIRLGLALLATVVALVGVISTQLLVVSCVHAALHVTQAAFAIPLCVGWAPSCWHENGPATCLFECALIGNFALILRYVLLPPLSILSTTRRHSRQLKRFFQQHDRKYVALVDRLLDDYTGNERLLFARIRKIYRAKPLSPP